MVLFQNGNHAAQHFYSYLGRRFINLDYLKATRQSRVTFHVFFVFCPRSGCNGAQFSTRQRWFEQVGGVALTFSTASPDELMRLINKQYDWRCRGLDFSNNRLEPIFKFALHARACLQQSQVQGTHRNVLQCWRYITKNHPLGKPFYHGRFPYAGFSGEDWVILAAAQKHVNDLANLIVTAPYRVYLALTGLCRDVNGELIQRGCVRAVAAR